MHLSVYLPLALSALFGCAAPALARRLPPAIGTWLLSAGSLCAAAGSAAALALLGSTLVGQVPALATLGRWSGATLRHADPVSAPIAALANGALLVLAIRFASAAAHRYAAVRAAYRLASELPASGGELAVIDHPGHEAYAVPGRPGRIVVSKGLLRGLDAGQRRAVLAHERAHLIHRHHLHHAAVHLAAAANPLLHRLTAAVALATERWADEDAAATCRRDTVADALTLAGTGASVMQRRAAVLAATANDVAARVVALRSPAPGLTVWRVAVLLGLLAATGLTALEAAFDTHTMFEVAQYAYRAGQH